MAMSLKQFYVFFYNKFGLFVYYIYMDYYIYDIYI